MQEYSSYEIEKLRKKLIDYFGSATPFFAAAMADVAKVEDMDDDEIIEEAEKIGLI